MEDRPMSVPKAAEACGISPQTLRRLIKEHNIPVSQPRCHKRVKLSDVERHVKPRPFRARRSLSREAESLLS